MLYYIILLYRVLYIIFHYIIIIKKGSQCKAGRERLTPYQSEDPNPTTPTHRMEEKGEDSRRQKVSEQLGQ